MIELHGKYNYAKVFTNNVEETAMSQIIELCNQEFVKDSKIRIMPDTHAGKGCTIGTTMTIQDKIVPNLVGVDIGCGMEVSILKLNKSEVDFGRLDEAIRKKVPSGFNIRDKAHSLNSSINYGNIIMPINDKIINRAEKSIGTLGGGNHFIELNEGGDGVIYIVIHSGSRNIGKTIADYYQDIAYESLSNINNEKDELINKLKLQGRESEIQAELKNIARPKFKKELAWLEGNMFKSYMNDMQIAQHYAKLNRMAMMHEIIKEMEWTKYLLNSFTTIHNYIDEQNMILRKGAISAQKNEKVIIPINMRDGSILATGKGNPDWNYSGPHGAGRIMSRSKAKENINMDDFKNEMNNVWSTSVKESTLDEAPMAYKPINEILDNIDDTLTINQIIKPLYNFKAN